MDRKANDVMDRKIVRDLKAHATAENRDVLKRFFKTGKGEYGYGDVFLGVKVPDVRSVVKKHWEKCDWIHIEHLVNSKYHEVRLAGLLVLVKKFHWGMKHDLNVTDEVAQYYLEHTDCINNWDLVDLTAYEILGRWVLEDTMRCDVLTKLVDSHDMWEQRIGIVSTMMLVRHGDFELTLCYADTLLESKHDLIQKAVGWLLREVGKRNRVRLEEHLKPRYKAMPRTMLRYAIEKFPEPLRKAYLAGQVEQPWVWKSPRRELKKQRRGLLSRQTAKWK